MNSLRILTNNLAIVVLLVSQGVMAEDLVSPKTQSDEKISVWANNAPLELFLSELAHSTGRVADIEGELQGSVTGRFNGSMIETLGVVGKQHAVLFDLQETTLGVVSDSQLHRETFALNETQSADDLLQALSTNVVPGNSIEIGVTEVIASGHPAFVNRVGQSVTLEADVASLPAVASATPVDEETDLVASAVDIQGDIQKATDERNVTSQDTDAAIDTETSIMLESELTATDTDNVADSVTDNVTDSVAGSDTVSADDAAKPIRWVTDIPGFNTF